MAILAYTITQFDIVAIQEIRDKKETAIIMRYGNLDFRKLKIG